MGSAAAGDVSSFTGLVAECDQQMRALAFSILRDRDAMDDALQTAYLKAFRSLHTFEGRSGFNTWLYSIVYRTCIDELRRRRPTEPLDEMVDVLATPGLDVADRVGLGLSIDQALQELPVDQRAAVLLVDAHGLSFDEAARVLGIPPGTLGSRLSRARSRLRRLLHHHVSPKNAQEER